ncbi:uncharacterized protein LOC121378077 [Gigantopelta aegis]|uniref:uncharacterized protein LOC121378077 n=1 Tax=Gigantopelta aegis TaxID=1735272 RepID=UPI001B88D43A|nr:uncharacterized protein LOC121378077 [Gigantopelta aegis]
MVFSLAHFRMKTSYFLVVLVALTLVPEDVDGWFFRSVRRIRISPYHTLGCMAACKWARSWACKACKRKRGLDQHTAELDDEALDVPKVLQTLDVNGDGFRRARRDRSGDRSESVKPCSRDEIPQGRSQRRWQTGCS